MLIVLSEITSSLSLKCTACCHAL